ncbi:hypothetical protein [Phaffia rhodozyma]|uniref:Uncharacterized protein n=1 Tax=Phaffia rhodozyma TaxID=264483 RepID=A0A0F7SGN3_PHARH|nr:hypothetical protein [Phaffia rhodozyma]
MFLPPPPPLPSALVSTLLSYLVPTPNPPIPPDLMSIDLLQRHQFLPPPLDEPIAHFTPMSSNTKQGAEILQMTGDLVEEVGRLMGGGEHPVLTASYKLPDSQTLQARILLYATHSNQPSLEIRFVYESVERGWRFHELRNISNAPPGDQVGWVVDLDQAASSRGQLATSEQGDQDDGVEDDGDGDEEGADDFWGGYDSPKQDDSFPTSPEGTANGSLPGELERKQSSASLDDYWTRYDGVEDGLAPTAPPTPHTHDQPEDPAQSIDTNLFSLNSSPSTDSCAVAKPSDSVTHRRTSSTEEDRVIYGTGGETPIGWTPVHGMTPATEFEPAPPTSATQGWYARGAKRASYGFPSYTEEEGTYPKFPAPPFKGLTPASETFELPNVDHTYEADSPEAEEDAKVSGSTVPSDPPPFIGRPPSSKMQVSPDRSLSLLISSSVTTNALQTQALRSSLQSILQMHVLSTRNELTATQAAEEFAQIARQVVLEASTSSGNSAGQEKEKGIFQGFAGWVGKQLGGGDGVDSDENTPVDRKLGESGSKLFH